VLADVNPLAALARAARGFGVDVGCAPGGARLFRDQAEQKESQSSC